MHVDVWHACRCISILNCVNCDLAVSLIQNSPTTVLRGPILLSVGSEAQEWGFVPRIWGRRGMSPPSLALLCTWVIQEGSLSSVYLNYTYYINILY